MQVPEAWTTMLDDDGETISPRDTLSYTEDNTFIQQFEAIQINLSPLKINESSCSQEPNVNLSVDTKETSHDPYAGSQPDEDVFMESQEEAKMPEKPK